MDEPSLVTNPSLSTSMKESNGAKNNDAAFEPVYLAPESKSRKLFFDSMSQTDFMKRLSPEAQVDFKMRMCKLVTETEVQYSVQKAREANVLNNNIIVESTSTNATIKKNRSYIRYC